MAKKHYVLKSGVKLDSSIEAKVGKIADKYYKAVTKDLTVTSGTRDGASQAVAMFGKMKGGDKLAIYKDKKSAKAILDIYEAGVKAKDTDAKIKKAITAVIVAQIKKKIYISKHLRKGAVDIRSKDMNAKEKKAFPDAAKGISKKTILEKTPPHWHLQF